MSDWDDKKLDKICQDIGSHLGADNLRELTDVIRQVVTDALREARANGLREAAEVLRRESLKKPFDMYDCYPDASDFLQMVLALIDKDTPS